MPFPSIRIQNTSRPGPIIRLTWRLVLITAVICLGGYHFGLAQEKAVEKEKTEGTGGGKKEEKNPANHPSGLPIQMEVSRRTLTNFLTDPMAIAPYKNEDGTLRPLRSTFVLKSSGSDFAIIWDELTCRLSGIVDLRPVIPGASGKVEKTEKQNSHQQKESGKDDANDAKEEEEEVPSPYVLKAAGPAPFTPSCRESETSHYFGFRMTDGKPEFLYSHGKLALEECLWLDGSGQTLRQRFRIKNQEGEVKLTFPEDWKKRMETSAGKWKDLVLIIPKEKASEFILTYHLTGQQ